jgi:hypothetical protein
MRTAISPRLTIRIFLNIGECRLAGFYHASGTVPKLTHHLRVVLFGVYDSGLRFLPGAQ